VTSVVNRYYDPTTDEFLSIDPDVASTDQPYVFTNDDPLNAEDPLGLCFVVCWSSVGHGIASGFDATRHFVAANSGAVGIGFGLVALTLATGGGDLVIGGVVFTAEQVSAAAIGAGAVGTLLDSNSCNNGSALGCAGFALGSLSGGSALIDATEGSEEGVNLLSGFSRAAKVSIVSGSVGLLTDVINYVDGADKSKAPVPKKKSKWN
jgi:hypothetical protein